MFQAPGYLENLRQNPQIAAFDAQFNVIDRAVAFLTSGELISGLFGGILGPAKCWRTRSSPHRHHRVDLYFLITCPPSRK